MKIFKTIVLVILMGLMFSLVAVGAAAATENAVVGAFGVVNIIDSNTLTIELSGKGYDDTLKSATVGETIKLVTEDRSETYSIAISNIMPYQTANGYVDLDLRSGSGVIRNRLFEEDRAKMGYHLQFHNGADAVVGAFGVVNIIDSNTLTIELSGKGYDDTLKSATVGETIKLVTEDESEIYYITINDVQEYQIDNGIIDIDIKSKSGAIKYRLFEEDRAKIGYHLQFHNGAKTDEPTEEFCSDSDGGENIYQKGKISGPFSPTDEGKNIVIDHNYEDFCVDENTVAENYCSSNGYITGRDLACPANHKCISGACVRLIEEELNCNDAEGGDGYYSLCLGNVIKHETEIKLKAIKLSATELILKVVNTGEDLVFNKSGEAIYFNYGRYSYKVEYTKYDPKGMITIYVSHVGAVEIPLETSTTDNIEVIKRITYPETKPVEISKEACSGCRQNGNCLPYGTRLLKDGKTVYCHIDGTLQEQAALGSSCQNNYECSSNQCSNAKCIDLSGQIEETKGILEKIFNWLKRIFG